MSVLATHAMGRPVLFASLALAGFLVAGRAETLPAENRAATFTEWQILDAKAGHVVGFEDFMASLLRRVAKEGLLGALKDPEMLRWQMRDEVLSDEPAYREVMVSQLRACHGGLSEEAYQRMYEAALFRDEGMAKTISEQLSHRAP